MVSWSAKRKFYYGGGFTLFLAVITLTLFFSLIYKAPVCSDGLKNGDEIGIDCGGSCQNLCQGETILPIVYWAKAFNISGDVYNLAAYVENPNIDSKNLKATYEFRIFDDKNILLDFRKGETYIPKNKKFIIFEPGFVIPNRKPKYVQFSFLKFDVWQKDIIEDPILSIKNSPLYGTSTSPKIDGTINNKSLKDIRGIELVAVVLDSKENAVAVSRTFVDSLSKSSTQDFVFTWPKPFNLGVEACSVPLEVSLALDRSGSMQFESKNPQEPFTTVKNTAKDFIKSLSLDDKVSLVSFGTEAVLNSELSTDKEKALLAIDSLIISTTSTQTNIGDGLSFAFKEITSYLGNAKKVIILLTDGQPTEPSQKSNPDYPKTYAESIAKDILSSKVDIYTIGLGKEVNDDFLKSLVAKDSLYFKAPTKEDLSSIYRNISSSLCVKKPSVVNIIYRILPE